MKKSISVHFSSETDDWATPQWLYDELNAKYGPFRLDPCCSRDNQKCLYGFTSDDGADGLSQDWNFQPDMKVFMNPPYGREIGKWIAKAADAASKGATVVALLPARTDTKYFHDFIYNKPNVSVTFLKGRLKFGNATNSAPFPSMVVVFRPGTN